ncbi:class B sortase [Ruminococcaceae bacterium OttesenSCG-928-A16]|nr:class B sortase [Ruminococcaceae bacterium OttesenSCG-928-A16]
MKNIIIRGHGFKKLLAVFLCALFVLTLFPVTAFAWPVDGNPASSWYGDNIVGADGSAYYAPAPWSYMKYNSDGTVSYGSHNGGNAYKHFIMADASGASRWVYCVEGGVNFTDSSGGYTPDSGYMSLLPSSAQYGIKIASLYGWQPGAALPVSGINENDFYMATQIIIWEYQQQVRSDPHSRHDNGPVSANQFYGIIAGRPAERAYNWILDKIAAHSTLPSFTGSSAGNAPVHELKWDTVDKVYRLTLTDTNNLNIDFQRLSGSGVTITRSGNRYTFTSTKMIMEPVTFKFRKDVPEAGGILIWGRPGYQTMMTGAEDPVSFYMNIKTETYGWARLIKTSEDGIVAGIRFNISGTDVLGQSVNMDVTTGANGRVDAKLLPGTYLVKEYPVDRYVTPAPQYVTIESAQVSEVHFTNILKKFRVLLTKTDADTGVVQGDATLAGAQYGLYKGGELQDIYTTDATGQFLTRYYVCGTDWTIRELVPSTGYLLDETVHPVGADPRLYEVELNTTENHVTETVIYGNIRLIKHTDDWDENIPEDERPAEGEGGNVGMIEQPEAGAVFEIYLRSAGSYQNAKETERDILTTDADGFAVSKMLPYGYYTVHQVAAGPAGENKAFVPDFTVFVCHDGYTYSYILNNDSITGRVRVEKRDAETGEIIPIAGTGFRIKDMDTGAFVSQTAWYPNPITIDLFYTSDEGWLMLPDALPMNTNGYELYEEYAPYGYVLDGEVIPFTIDGSEAIVTVVQKNMPQKGTVTITKTGEVFASVEENEGYYQPIYEVMGLPGAVYDLIADEDITTGDGTVRVPKDTIVETLTTGEDATATSGLLYLGRYRLEEREAPYGMVLDPEPVYVELVYAGQDVEVTHTAVGIYDERQRLEIDLVKSLEIDELFDIGLADEYKGVSFGLYAAHDIFSLDGSMIPADGLLEVVSIEPVEGEPGRYAAAFAADLPFGSYYVQERTTSKEYVLNNTQYPVVFGYAGQEIAVVSITTNDGEDIDNDLLRGDIEGFKRGENPDGEQPIMLGGAKLGLFHPDDEEMTKETALLVTVSAEDGSFSFTDIPFGHWVIKEYEAPPLYTVSPQYHHVYVGVDGQIIEIRVDNTLIRGSVQLIKTEAVDEPGAIENEDDNPFMKRLPGAVFELYEDTNGNGEFDEGDTLLGELEETDAGFHQAIGLLASGYFIKEKTAPAGCILDENAYYFEITEDGQIAVVENSEAGRGFVNEAYRGNLRIVKDSSDGRKDGFAFEVRSADGAYCETFTSGSTGIIEITGLRIGKYTVTEIANRASKDYIIPDGATVTIKMDETTVVRFFNEKPKEPETPTTPTEPGTSTTPTTPTTTETVKPVPQTSDDNMIFVWIAVLGIAAIGGAVSIMLYVKNRKGKRSAVVMVALLVCVALIVSSGYMLAQEAGKYAESASAYEKLTTYVDEADPRQEGDDNVVSRLPRIDFDALLDVNPDIRAWLLCEDTAISYPVVQGEDNDHYLKHLFDGTQNKAGCLFIDYENEPFTDKNTIVYGHNMLDGAMFAGLPDYGEQGYYDVHPDMLLVTPDGGHVVELFAAFVASPNESGAETSPWNIAWETESDYAEWLSSMQGRSLFQSDVELSDTDRVLTLSTCINNGRDRFVVMGRLVIVE